MANFDDLKAQLGGMDPLDAPTPGQSLTTSPESKLAFEKAPQFTNQQKAVEDIFMKMTSEDKIDGFLDLMRDGVPVEYIAQVVLFEGFRSGAYNPDLMLLLVEPVIYILLYLADYANIEDVVLDASASSGALSASTGQAVEGLEGEGGESTITVGDTTVQRPDSVTASLLDKIAEKTTPEDMTDGA